MGAVDSLNDEVDAAVRHDDVTTIRATVKLGQIGSRQSLKTFRSHEDKGRNQLLLVPTARNYGTPV